MKQDELIKLFESFGLEVNLNTKARGHQGFFLDNRIDISKNVKEERVIPTLLHEFAHFIHSKIEGKINKTGGSLEVLLGGDENFASELIKVTNFVDPHSLCERLLFHKNQVKARIKNYEKEIKQYYPKFMRSKKFKEFDKYIKKSNAKYLLKYDRVRIVSPFLRREEIFSIQNLEKDFADMPSAFAAYIRLRSYQKKQARISSRINKLNKYYQKPTELFARLVEGLYIDFERTKTLAPCSTARFLELLTDGYYLELTEVFNLLKPEVFVLESCEE